MLLLLLLRASVMCFIHEKRGGFNVSLEEERKNFFISSSSFHNPTPSKNSAKFSSFYYFTESFIIFFMHTHTRSVQLIRHHLLILYYYLLCWAHTHTHMRVRERSEVGESRKFLAYFPFSSRSHNGKYFIIYSHLFEAEEPFLYLLLYKVALFGWVERRN